MTHPIMEMIRKWWNPDLWRTQVTPPTFTAGIPDRESECKKIIERWEREGKL